MLKRDGKRTKDEKNFVANSWNNMNRIVLMHKCQMCVQDVNIDTMAAPKLLVIDNLVQFEEDFNSWTKKSIRWGGGVISDQTNS